jgi:hypothetical protein
MATTTLDEKKLKTLLKSAFAEALKEQRNLISSKMPLKISLVRAIEQGLHSKPVSRAAVYKILEGKS